MLTSRSEKKQLNLPSNNLDNASIKQIISSLRQLKSLLTCLRDVKGCPEFHAWLSQNDGYKELISVYTENFLKQIKVDEDYIEAFDLFINSNDDSYLKEYLQKNSKALNFFRENLYLLCVVNNAWDKNKETAKKHYDAMMDLALLENKLSMGFGKTAGADVENEGTTEITPGFEFPSFIKRMQSQKEGNSVILQTIPFDIVVALKGIIDRQNNFLLFLRAEFMPVFNFKLNLQIELKNYSALEKEKIKNDPELKNFKLYQRLLGIIKREVFYLQRLQVYIAGKKDLDATSAPRYSQYLEFLKSIENYYSRFLDSTEREKWELNLQKIVKEMEKGVPMSIPSQFAKELASSDQKQEELLSEPLLEINDINILEIKALESVNLIQEKIIATINELGSQSFSNTPKDLSVIAAKLTKISHEIFQMERVFLKRINIILANHHINENHNNSAQDLISKWFQPVHQLIEAGQAEIQYRQEPSSCQFLLKLETFIDQYNWNIFFQHEKYYSFTDNHVQVPKTVYLQLCEIQKAKKNQISFFEAEQRVREIGCKADRQKSKSIFSKSTEHTIEYYALFRSGNEAMLSDRVLNTSQPSISNKGVH